MRGPGRLIREGKIQGYKNISSVHEWQEGKAYLLADEIEYEGKKGFVITYYNPPVHQVGNPGLDAYLEALKRIDGIKENHDYVILYGANDPVHAGGDLKESLKNLDKTLEAKERMIKEGKAPEEIDKLYEWADNRIKKGVTLHHSVRKIAESLRVVAVCGGGTRFGGSAEIPLMADYIVGDSRSGMCFSEAMIGLIPGWSGVARAVVKAGELNARYMAMTSRELKADKLKQIGIYNTVVQIPFDFPKRPKGGDPDDKKRYLNELEVHDQRTGELLLPQALRIATMEKEQIPALKEIPHLVEEKEMFDEVNRRKNPENYSHIIGKSLKKVKEEITRLGRPLAPQSIEALEELFRDSASGTFNEWEFAEKEGQADSRLYRDPRFREGLISTLEQRVPDFRI